MSERNIAKLFMHGRSQAVRLPHIGPDDILIAAWHADATLVTANTREFSRVPGLRLDDWS